MRTFFYLVVSDYDESTTPLKIFINENQANSAKIRLESKELDPNRSYRILRQDMGISSDILKPIPPKVKHIDIPISRTRDFGYGLCYPEDDIT